MDQQGIAQPLLNKPVFDPTYLNIEYVFNKILAVIKPIIAFFSDPHTWVVLGIVSSCISILFIAVIIFSLVRMREIQMHEKHELDHEINEALARDKEAIRNDNPRWHYILTLIESSNESDWRVAIIEADSMLEELLREKGLTGEGVSELLESARDSGYRSIQGAWDAHIVRNQIAHSGSEFSLTQIEGRRVIKMYQNFFEELEAI
jgi:hypothetical protein